MATNVAGLELPFQETINTLDLFLEQAMEGMLDAERHKDHHRAYGMNERAIALAELKLRLLQVAVGGPNAAIYPSPSPTPGS